MVDRAVPCSMLAQAAKPQCDELCEQQAAFVAEEPEVFVPIAGGWGRMGCPHIVLAKADEDLMTGALRTAWKLRIEKNAKAGKKPSGAKKKQSGRR